MKMKEPKLLQEGDECLRCDGFIKNVGIWTDSTRTHMAKRVILCPACEFNYRYVGEKQDKYPTDIKDKFKNIYKLTNGH